MTILSILICGLESRHELLGELIKKLKTQQISFLIDRRLNTAIQILVETDNKQKSTGYKRQLLLDKSKGEYIVFIDDDDIVPDYYIEEMYDACMSGADCIAINGRMTTNGSDEIAWRLSKDYQNETIIENGRPVYLRRTNHITAVKREIALAAGFNDVSNGEDKYYSERLNLKTEYKIEKPMYHYRFSTLNKEY